MRPRILNTLLSVCVGSVLTLATGWALAAGEGDAQERLPEMLSPGGDSAHGSAAASAAVPTNAPAASSLSTVPSNTSAVSSLPTMPALTPVPAPTAASGSAPAAEATPATTTPTVIVPWLALQSSGAGAYQPLASAITVAQMGQLDGITLAGGQAQAGIVFTLPADQVITNARLDLSLRVSPELAALNTSMQMMLNGQPLGTIPLNSASGGETANYQLDIPAAMVVSSNNLSFRVNDAERLLCERDSAARYNVTILPTTSLQLEGQQLNIGTRLANFPRPFIDNMQMTPAIVPMVFPANVSPAQVSAAMLVASWMGIQRDGYGVSFPALHDALPEKNGIVFGMPGQKIGSLTLPDAAGPTLKLIDNPDNPVYKLMLVLGRDEGQLRQAAYRLVSQTLDLDDSTLAVAPQTIPFRKAYDAPTWITTDRPVHLSELLRKDQSMTTSGIWHDPLRINFRAAPDLFLWDGGTVPVQIDYRFPAESWIDEDRSQLNVTLNGTFLRNLTVNKIGALQHLWRQIGGDSRQESYLLKVEPYLIYGYNQFQLYFDIRAREDAPCNVLLNNNIKSQIKDSASIDLTDTRHFTLLPNLSYFVGAAFPFSRLADYAQTVIMLPEKPSDAEISLALDLAGRAGDSTGVTLNHNRVIFGLPNSDADREKLRNSDVLVVSSLQQSGFPQSLLDGSPFRISGHTLGANTLGTWPKLMTLLTGDWERSPMDADRYFSSNEAWRGFISYRSPWSSDRVVVMATASNDEQLLRLHSDLNVSALNAGIRGDAAIITDENGVHSFRVGPQFPRGEMPWYMMLVWYANQHAVLLALSALALALVLGLGLAGVLKRQIHRRLNTRQRYSGSEK
ncbi:cellulose biosynthesis cyclic di-GMP-binding regulatory protein BcsB [Musicola paradisiaca]|uniref:Cyclic di-GMP-binding protein n=1 Tax=Musicola paradisiaca (strain Ech703) TaxID=579405 RepID=C6C638_MUSP7|nr:cellulose biosynthesis cyclic di-GMP-binding regulatory protein BcsB [Musicola paradisiaca]ACS87647.1 cellulose synthase subunit B [Musicola paradisiaca Ech703]